MATGDPERKLRIGIWAVDLPRRYAPDDPGLLQVIAGLVGAGNEVLLVAEQWQGPTPPGLFVTKKSHWRRMPHWAKGLLALRAMVRPLAAQARRILAPLRGRKNLLLLLALLPLAPLSLLARFGYRLLSASGRPLFRRVESRRRREVARLVARIVPGARCDVWLVLSAQTSFPFAPGVRCAWLLDGPPNRPSAPVLDDTETADWHKAARLGDTGFNGTLFLVHSRESLAGPSIAGCGAVQDRYRVLPVGDADAWLDALEDAASLPLSECELTAPLSPNRPYHVRVFLPMAYRGGVWEAARTLLVGLDEVNRGRRNPLQITLAFAPGQAGLDALAAKVPGLRIEQLTQQLFPAAGGGTQALPWSPSALRADAWFSLVDRFRYPMMVVRPLGVMVYDVIQKYLPEIFSEEFHTEYIPSMRATVARADLVITTNPVTRLDVAEEYALARHRVALVPVACEPGSKFGGQAARAVPVPSGHLLNITNISPHKGIVVVMRAYARLKRELGGRGPGLVFSGNNTHLIGPSYTGPEDAVLRGLRDVLRELGLVPGEDVWFLGYTDDAQLHDLYERCGAVINAARYDNGTFSLIEARYFGKPAVSSRYPAAVALYDHFGIPVDYFEADDDRDLAETLFRVMNRPTLAGEELARCREALADPKFSHRRHAEQVYELLLDLARRGREAGRRAA